MATLYQKVKARNKKKRKEYIDKKLAKKPGQVFSDAGAMSLAGGILGGRVLSKSVFGAAVGYLAVKAKKENTLYRSKGWKNMIKRQAVMEKTAYRMTSARKAALKKAQQISARLRRKN